MPVQLESLSALVVDDSKLIRSLVITALNELKIGTIEEAVNGREAMAKLANKKYDLVVLDWTMPEASGKDVLEKIREEGSINEQSLVFMVTAEASKEKVIEIIKLKVSGYIVKPFTISSLAAKIKKIVELRMH